MNILEIIKPYNSLYETPNIPIEEILPVEEGLPIDEIFEEYIIGEIMASITLTNPIGTGIVIAKNYPITIKWTHVGVGNKIGCELWKGATKVLTIANGTDSTAWANTGTHTWTPPNTLVDGIDYKLKIIGCVTCSSPYTWVSYTSANSFTIATASITLTYPTATGLSLIKGNSIDITWTSTGLGTKIGCELMKGGTEPINKILTIAEGSQITAWNNNGTHSWTIPTTLTDGTDYKIKLYGCIINHCSISEGWNWIGTFSTEYFTISTTAVTRYKCTSGTCTENATGTYTSQTECETARKYAIINNTCTLVCPDYSGTKYDSLEACNSANTRDSGVSNNTIYVIAIIAIIFVAVYFIFVS